MAKKALTVPEIFRELRKIADCKGTGSQQERVDLIRNMMNKAVGSEAKFIIRHCQGKLRIGMSEKTVLAACASAFARTVVDPESKRGVDRVFRGDKAAAAKKAEEKSLKVLKQVFSELPDWGRLLPEMIAAGDDWEEVLPTKCFLSPGIPIHPMLAKPTKGISEVLDRFSNVAFTCEYKYDGERAQVSAAAVGLLSLLSRDSNGRPLLRTGASAGGWHCEDLQPEQPGRHAQVQGGGR